MSLIFESIKVLNQLRNDDDFLTAPADFTNTVKANIGGLIKIITKFRFSWEAIADPVINADTFRVAVVAGGHSVTSLLNQDFAALGFRKGDVFTFNDIGGLGVMPGQVLTLVNGPVMEFALAAPLVVGDYTNAELRGTSQLNNLLYNFNFTDTENPTNLVSEIFGLIPTYEFSNLVIAGGDITGVYQGLSSTETGSAVARQLATVNTYQQVYEIETILKVPYFQEGEFVNLQTQIAPPPYLTGTKFYAEAVTFGVSGSSETNRFESIIRTINDSIGWNNENFNGGRRDYSLISVDYTEKVTGDVREVPEVTEVTVITVVMAANNTTFVATDPTVFTFSYLPTNAAALNDTDTFDDTWVNEKLRTLLDAGAVSGTIITNFTAVISDAGATLTLLADLQFTIPQLAKMFNDGEFKITIDNETAGGTAENSNRVSLIVDANNITKNSDEDGLMNVIKDEFYYLPDVFTEGSSAGNTDVNEWNTGLVMRDFRFRLTAGVDLIELQSLHSLVIGYNPTDDVFFIIQKVIIPTITQAITTSSGKKIQQINTDTERGFLQPAGSQFNFLKITNDNFADPYQFYKGQIGMFIDWQDYFSLEAADQVFFDASQPNNGLNKKTSNYSDLNNFEIRMAFLHAINKEDNVTEYLTIGPKSLIFDYDLDKNPSPLFTTTHVYTDVNNQVLPLRLMIGEENKLSVTWDDGNVKVTDNFEARISLEIFEQGTENSIHTIDSVNGVIEGDILQPLLGETLLNKGVILDNFTSVCRIDGTKLSKKQYSIYSALYEIFPVFQICFDVLGSPSFDPVVVTTVGEATWNFGDGSPEVIDLAPIHVYADTNPYEVCLSFPTISSFTSFQMDSDSIVGILNLSVLTKLESLRFNSNPLMTGLILPASDGDFTGNLVQMFNCDIKPTMDLSPLVNLGGNVNFQNNVNLTSVITGTSTKIITQFFWENCDIKPIFDISGYVDIDKFNTTNNTNLEQIINPVSTAAKITQYICTNNALQNLVDFTGYSTAFTAALIDLDANNLSVAQVSQILIDLDANVMTGTRIKLQGQVPAAPPNAAGVIAAANLTGRGVTVTTD